MPGYDWTELPDTLRGAFGVFQRAASARLTTTDVWESLNAWTTSQAKILLRNRGKYSPTMDELSAAEDQLRAGWNVQGVSAMRGLAGSWLRAKQSLASQQGHEMPAPGSIFKPPWATTSGIPGIRPTYRFRIRLDITPPEGYGEMFQQWATIEHTGPLTSIDDLLLGGMTQGIMDRYRMSGGPLNLAENSIAISSYEIEEA